MKEDIRLLALAAVFGAFGLALLSPIIFFPRFIVFCNQWWTICWPFG